MVFIDRFNKDQVSLLAIAANVFLFLIKLIVGLLSRSYGILADAINSGSDIIASTINYVGIKVAKKPVDAKHPYGYHKYEVLFGFFVTLIIFGSALYIVFEGVRGLIVGNVVTVNALSLGVMIVSAGINEVMARLKIGVGKRDNSIGLIADGVHSRIDVLSSAGVLVGLVVTPFWQPADSVVAILVGLYILKESIELGKETTTNLLDVSADAQSEQAVKDIVRKEGFEIGNLKTQKRGSSFTANLGIRLPGDMPVKKASDMLESLRNKLLNDIESLSYITISIEGESVSQSAFRSGFGRYSWRSRARGDRESKDEYCVCPECGKKVRHKRGVPCKEHRCPGCDIPMKRAETVKKEEG